MLLRSQRFLHYPITVTDLLCEPGDSVERSAPLFSYFYKTTVIEGDRFGDEHKVEKTFPTRFESPVEGILRSWKIKKGSIIRAPNVDLAEIEEPCAHDVQFGGMCANCGKDMTEVAYNSQIPDAERAKINMIHNNIALTVSQDKAANIESEAKRRLLKTRKLSLVVDLDQTIIHATVDPTVGEWQKDESNPNHEAVKDVQSFQLLDDGINGHWYYIKLRPHLKEFLERVSKSYELHIYTMGTRAYAQNIAKIVDPDRKIFGDRILSRDESGSLTVKSLQRLFPMDTSMVVIIDDRGDVWKWNDNLIKVIPYDFFVGIGDINSSFLPKKPDLRQVIATDVHGASTSESKQADNATSGDTEEAKPAAAEPGPEPGNVSPLEQLVSMSGGDDPALLQKQVSKQDEALAAQLNERPLLQKQKQLDAEDDASDESAAKDEGGTTSNGDSRVADHQKQRHHLLQDNDSELQYLEQSLLAVHQAFFDEYERRLATAQGGRIAQLRGERSSKVSLSGKPPPDLQVAPDIKVIMPKMKTKVLEGVVIVFSGVFPLDTDIQSADIALWAKSFGAQVSETVTRRTTHVIATRNRTAKLRQAARYPEVHIVGIQWLFECLRQWKRLDENPYLIEVHPEDRAKSAVADFKDEVLYDPESNVLSSEEDDQGEEQDEDDDDANSELPASQSFSDEREAQELQTEDIDDPDDLIPSDMDDGQSPIGGTNEDWQEMQDEIASFLGSDADDSDTDSVASTASARSVRKRKRSSSPVEGDADEASKDVPEPGDPDGSALALKKRRAYERTTNLKEVASTAEPSDRSSRSEAANAPEDDGDLAADLERELEADLETELEAELEREEEETADDD